MDIRVLLEPTVDLPRLGKLLDELGHAGRLWVVQSFGKRDLAALFEAAQGADPVTLEGVVPADVAPLVEVIHHGKNSLPMRSHFQKRFCRASSEPGLLWGYNHQAMAWATGPGYFVTRMGETAGEIDIDYTCLPTEKPTPWPAIVPNTARLGRFVYAGMVDILRRVSSHVTIGRAKKGGGFMDAWFALVREDGPRG